MKEYLDVFDDKSLFYIIPLTTAVIYLWIEYFVGYFMLKQKRIPAYVWVSTLFWLVIILAFIVVLYF